MVLLPPLFLLQESISANEPPFKEFWALFNQVPLHEASWVSVSRSFGVVSQFIRVLWVSLDVNPVAFQRQMF